MRVRLGYVANALRLQDCSPSKTVTLANLEKLSSMEHQIARLTQISRTNLENTLRILKANYFDQIKVYRFTSKLIPLATHPQFEGWNFVNDLTQEFKAIGAFVKENQFRVSLHPDHFTLLNSPRPEVQAASLRDLEYHLQVLEAMGLGDEFKLVIHVGGKYNDSPTALARFAAQFITLPEKIKSRLTLENDDRSFTAPEVLKLCQKLKIPMVLDLHHQQLLNQGEEIQSLLPEVFATWGNLLPKLHCSSPRDQKNPRNHADFINPDIVVDFLKLAQQLEQDFDLMLEAKQKDLALFRLGEDLKKSGYHLPNAGEILI